jgi:hypothetical protein
MAARRYIQSVPAESVPVNGFGIETESHPAQVVCGIITHST